MIVSTEIIVRGEARVCARAWAWDEEAVKALKEFPEIFTITLGAWPSLDWFEANSEGLQSPPLGGWSSRWLKSLEEAEALEAQIRQVLGLPPI